jgi:hypothetical protein
MAMNKPPERVTYEGAINIAWDELVTRDPYDISNLSGIPYDPEEGRFIMMFLGDEYHISTSNKTVKFPNGQDVYSFLAVLLLHYLVNVKDIDLTDKLLSFRELEGGDVYYPAFCARGINKITAEFGIDSKQLKAAGEKLGAKEGKHGDVSIVLEVFPKIPVTVIVWEGDDEVPPSSNMLFDSLIKELLPTEDVAVIGGFVASALIQNKN